MSTLHLEPVRARLLATELLDAAARPPLTPVTATGPGRFAASLIDALHHLDSQTRRVHDRARVLGERSHRVIDAADLHDRTLAAELRSLS
ncbi:hypothetical protein [Corynebacterium sp.]|uniref:hypothetical protein n=1 Tax=Corynebacterium sp. TaxID=1720 RepID=UPI0026DF33B9|nr:hypothetical protein [Corynebacterium sp.]MDO5512976.1 hypothetical protein [Corynebacterium sp.]